MCEDVNGARQEGFGVAKKEGEGIWSVSISRQESMDRGTFLEQWIEYAEDRKILVLNSNHQEARGGPIDMINQGKRVKEKEQKHR